jgi:hypothetical protein
MNEFPDSKISQVIGTRFRIGDYDLSRRKILAASLHLRGTLPYYGQSPVPFVMARLPEFKIGDHDVKKQILCFASIRPPPGGTLHKWGGLIGADLLFSRHAIIDLGNRGLYLMADKK